jgi:sugar lactone lactonase YvrE
VEARGKRSFFREMNMSSFRLLRALTVTPIALVVAACGGSSASKGSCADKSGIACTWAGITGSRGFNGDGLDRRESWLYFVEDLTFAPDGSAWIVDWNNHRIRHVEKNGTLKTLIGTDYEGDGPPMETDRLPLGNPPGAQGTDVALNHPTDLKFLPDGTAIIAAWHNNKLRTYDPKTGVVKVLAGDSYGFSGDGGPAYAAVFNQPKTLAIDTDGKIYTIDQRNERIRTIDKFVAGTIQTMAGTGTLGNDGDGGPALNAQFGFDQGVTPQPSGALALRGNELFLADSLNNRIRRIHLDTGMIDCIAGQSAKPGYSGDGGSALGATFSFPNDLEWGPDGRLYVADRYNNAIRAIDVDNDRVDTVAGNGHPCPTHSTLCAEAHDGVPAREIQLNNPYGIAFDPAGNLYIADTLNSRIVRVAR